MGAGGKWPRLGILLPYGTAADVATITSFAKAAERAGADGVWTYDMIGRATAHAEPLTALAACAAVTERVELGTSVLQLPLRNRAQVLQQVLTVQAISGDRLTLGVGAGSTPADFEVVGTLPFEDRFRRLGPALDELVSDLGAREVPSRLLPGWEVLSSPSVLIGSWAGGRWIERAATHHDGWIASAAKTDRQTIEEGVQRFRSLGGGRAIVTNVALEVRDRASSLADDRPFDLRGPLEELDARLRWLHAAGYDDAIVTAGADLDGLRRLIQYRSTQLPK